MKKISGLFAALFIAFGACGCSSERTQPKTESLPSFASGQSACVSQSTQSCSSAPESGAASSVLSAPESSATTAPAVSSLYTNGADPEEPPENSASKAPTSETAPSEAPIPEEPVSENTCVFSIECSAALNAPEAPDGGILETLPENGVIFAAAEVEFSDGETVFDVLKRVCRENKIHIESSITPLYGSAYIEGIANLYQFDCGTGSGWVYSVNGVSPNFSCSSCQLKPGDIVEWSYTTGAAGR